MYIQSVCCMNRLKYGLLLVDFQGVKKRKWSNDAVMAERVIYLFSPCFCLLVSYLVSLVWTGCSKLSVFLIIVFLSWTSTLISCMSHRSTFLNCHVWDICCFSFMTGKQLDRHVCSKRIEENRCNRNWWVFPGTELCQKNTRCVAGTFSCNLKKHGV